MTPRHPSQPSLGLRVWSGSLNSMPLPHSHPDLEINFLLGGRATYAHGSSRFILRPFEFTAFWAGLPHVVIDKEAETPLFWATIPLSLVLRWQLPAAFLRALLMGDMARQDSAPDDRARLDHALLQQWSRDSNSGQEARKAILAAEIEARLRRLALAKPQTAATTKPASPPLSIAQQVFDYASIHYSDVDSVDQLARRFHLNPKYLMRRFKSQFGLSLWEYVLRMRISHAQRLLLTTPHSVTAIAHDSGFHTLSAFYRAFAQYSSGMKPGQFRQLAPGSSIA